MINERERSVAPKRRQPQGDLRDFNCERIYVYAVEATLRYQPPRSEFALLEIDTHVRRRLAWVNLPSFDKTGCEIATRSDQECSGAHREVANLQVEQLGGALQ